MMSKKIRSAISILLITLSGSEASGQVNDTIYFKPKLTERIDTIKYSPSGKVKLIEFIASDKVLKRIYYNENGVLTDAEVYDSIGRTLWTQRWYSNGQLNYVLYNNRTRGTTWYDNGDLKSQINCLNDTITEVSYYKNGNLRKLTKEYSLHDSTSYYYYSVAYCENGRKISEDFSGRDYKFTSYYCNGHKQAKGEKNADRYLIGKYCEWHENGKVAVKGTFSQTDSANILTGTTWSGVGQKEGKWKYYDENGKLVKVEIWKGGKMISRVELK